MRIATDRSLSACIHLHHHPLAVADRGLAPGISPSVPTRFTCVTSRHSSTTETGVGPNGIAIDSPSTQRCAVASTGRTAAKAREVAPWPFLRWAEPHGQLRPMRMATVRFQ